jgi:hypothetical protein
MARRKNKVLAAIIGGGITAAALDLAAAVLIYHGAAVGVMKAIARGWLGQAALTGGAPAAALGLASHTLMLIVAAAIFVLATLKAPILRRRFWIAGPVFGAGVYVVMHYVVVPLSRAPNRLPQGSDFAWEFAAHLFLVGLVIAAWARTLLGRR